MYCSIWADCGHVSALHKKIAVAEKNQIIQLIPIKFYMENNTAQQKKEFV
jgi:hypothetical protein